MRGTGERLNRMKFAAPLRIHLLDGADELPGVVSEATSIAVATLAPLGYVVVVALDAGGRVTMYRQAEWISAGFAQPGRCR
jgi:hypothetical protein